MTDSTGKIVWSGSYSVFGELKRSNGEVAFTPSFTGKQLDSDTGLYYFNARWYSAELGRFINADPIRYGSNWYAYCSNNPLTMIDPSGLAEYDEKTGILSFNNFDDVDKATFEYLQQNLIGVNISDMSVVKSWNLEGGEGAAAASKDNRTIKGVEWKGTDWDENGKPKPILTYEDMKKVGARDNVPFGAKRAGYEKQIGKMSDKEYGLFLASEAIAKFVTEDNYSATGAIAPSLDEFTFMALGGIAKGIANGVLKNVGKMFFQNLDDAARYAQYWENLGKTPGTLSNRTARAWYLWQEGKIPGLLNKNLPLEQQAQQAFSIRNSLRSQARELMEDRKLAAKLNITEPNKTWSQIVEQYTQQGYSGDALWYRIIQGAQSSRASVNKGLGF